MLLRLLPKYIARAACAFIATAVSAAVAADESWTAETSIGVSYFHRGDGPSWFISQSGEAIRFSPDRRYFFFVTRRGDLACDCNVFDLKIFDAERVKDAAVAKRRDIAPCRTFTLRSRYHKGNEVAGLEQARWLGDGRTVAFLGAEADQPPQVYTFDVMSGETRVLSQAPFGVVAFDAGDGSLVYRGITERKRRTKLKTYPAVFIDPFDMGEITGFDTEETYRVVASYKGRPPTDVAPASVDETWLPYFVSPDGKYAVGLRGVQTAEEPPSWRAYGIPESTQAPALPRTSIPFQYVLIDLTAGTWRALLDAPTGAIAFIASYNKALWSPDSRHVILLNSMLPLGEPGRSTTSYVVDYDIRHGTWAILDSLTPTPDRRIADMEWLDPGRSVVVRRFSAVATGPAPEKKIFTLENGTWAPKTASADSAEGKAVPDDLAATIREGLNMPPVVVATYKGRQIQLTPEDPVVAAARRARIEVVEWRDRTGAAWTGGLTLPSAKPRAGKIPLVVQIYDFMPDRFLPDGVSTTAFAMQPLAARGIAVLQMSMPRVIVNEGPPFVEAVDSAAEMAAERYGIDPAKVGLLGFSRSGGRTSYAVTHPGRTKLAAALVADGGDANYALYLNYAATYPNIAKTAQGTLEAINGGTFWANKAAWLERAPGFNLDRVETPLLITSTGPFSFLVVNEMYTGLQILKKPIDVIMFPEGAHQLMMPRERLASMEATVDWMSYWLQGSKDPQPGKAAQYKRWDALRALRDGAQPAKAN